MSHSVKRGALRRLAGALLACGVGLTLVNPIAPPVPAQAAPDYTVPEGFATGGSGRFVDSIQWLQWATYSQFEASRQGPKNRPNLPVLDYGQTKDFVNTRDLGNAGTLQTVCRLSNLRLNGHSPAGKYEQAKGPLVATIPGTWIGDVLDNMYNIGGPGEWRGGGVEWSPGLDRKKDYTNKNQMVIGLGNGYSYNSFNTWDGQKWGTPGASTKPTGAYANMSVDLSCSASLRTPDGGQRPVDIQGLVFADAEASSNRKHNDVWNTPDANEWVQATTNQRVKWRVLDRMRSERCYSKYNGQLVGANAEFRDGGKTLRLMPTDEECVYQTKKQGEYNGVGGPAAVMFMEGATSATITLQGASYSAVALGLVISTDFGDAPKSYGHAGSLFQPSWEGGEVRRTTDVFTINPQASMGIDPNAPRLGQRIDAEGYQKFSDDAVGDDDNAADNDEDSLAFNPSGILTAPGSTHTEAIACEGTGKVAGWVDWDHNGTFDADEKSNEVACANHRATLRWRVPTDVQRSVDGEDGSQSGTFIRVRITNDNNGNNQQPTGLTTTGEVEDYKVAVRVPTLSVTKEVDNTYASNEVPGLSADQWTLTGNQGAYTATGAGDSGGPKVFPRGQVNLTETSNNPEAAGYEAVAWRCEQAAGTLPANGRRYSSTVGATNNSGSATLTINKEDRVKCKLVNRTKPGSLTWNKIDDLDNKIGGTTWTLTGPDVPAGTVVSDCTSGTCPTGAYKDQDPAPGQFRLTNLKWGSYSITEAQAPAGFTKVNGTFAFTQIKGSALEGTLVQVQGVKDNGVVNPRVSGSVSFKKVDKDTGQALGGSEWKLTGPGVPADTVVKDCAGTCPAGAYLDTDPKAGSLRVEGLSWSDDKYTLVEHKAPAGYVLDATTTHEFNIAANALAHTFAKPFENSKTKVPGLPLTGGTGAHVFLIGGTVLAALALVAGLIRRRTLKRA